MLQAKKLSFHHTLRWLLLSNLLKLARMNNKKSIQGGRGGTWSLKSVQGSPQGLGFYNLQMLWKVSMELLKQKIIVQLDLTETKICRTDKKKENYMGMKVIKRRGWLADEKNSWSFLKLEKLSRILVRRKILWSGYVSKTFQRLKTLE